VSGGVKKEVQQDTGYNFRLQALGSASMADNEPVGKNDEQLPGLSKIETIDYRWLLRRGDRCGPLELLRKEELERKHHAALSAHSIDMAAKELAVLKKTTERTQS
jgi:hypothetical protein